MFETLKMYLEDSIYNLDIVICYNNCYIHLLAGFASNMIHVRFLFYKRFIFGMYRNTTKHNLIFYKRFIFGMYRNTTKHNLIP